MNKDKKKRQMPPIGYVMRSFGISDMRAVEEGTYIEGHPAVYDQVTNIGDYFFEVIERGAFDGCNFDDVLFSANHQWFDKIPMARSRRNNGNSTMLIQVVEKGLYIKANLDIERNSDSKSLYSAVERGDINGMSFIFYVKEQRWTGLDTDMPTRYITKISRVREVSAVNYPAYEGTDINARDDQDALDNAARVLENARSELDNSKNEVELLRLKTQILMKG